MNAIMKKCSGTYGQTLELNKDNFKKRSNTKDGFRNQCRNCIGKGFVPEIIQNSGKIKKCTGPCGLKLDINKSNFQWRSDIKEFRKQCRKCYGKGNGLPEHIIVKNNKQYQICTGECQLELEICENNFGWCVKSKSKYVRKCKICFAKYQSEYQIKNAEKLSMQGKKYREDHKEELSQQRAIFRSENKEIIAKQNAKCYQKHKEKRRIKAKKERSKPENKEKRNERRNQKNKENPKLRIRGNLSGAVSESLKLRGSKKSRSISKSLSYTIDEFINHIEEQFKIPGNEWMTWNNRGVYNLDTWNKNDSSTWVWHLDHIIPQIEFNYISEDDQEFKDCWSLSNLRPLRADFNVIDGATRVRHNKKK